MKILTRLTAGACSEGQIVEPLGITTAVHNEPVPGMLRQMHLGAAGVTMTFGGEQVIIPSQELWGLAEAANRKFVPPAAAPPSAGQVVRKGGASAAVKAAVAAKAKG